MPSSLPLRRYVYDEVIVRKWHRLPHWFTPFGIYFITIHLRDAVPDHLLQMWRDELDDALDTARNEDEAREHEQRYLARIERALDEGYGARHLSNDRIASALRDTLLHDDRDEYDLLAWCVMPTHAHVVFRLLGKAPLGEVVKSWKSVSSRAATKEIGIRGLWQEDYFDVLVRDNHHLLHTVEYTLKNPAKAGLKEWPWSGMNHERIDELL